MSIEAKFKVNTHYTRSVNLERDSDSVDVLNAYIPTSRTIRTLERVAATLNSEQMPRAWSLIGPYGSGKSSFSIFAADLLASSDKQLNKIAHGKLADFSPKLQKSIRSRLSGSKGVMKVLVTGSPEPMAKRILVGFQQALDHAWTSRRGKRPPIFAQLQTLLDMPEPPVSEIMNFVENMQDALTKIDYSGVVLVIDELGKFLEYEARHYGANDIYLLQAIAEHACKGQQCNLLLFVMLHQSFEQYAKGLGENLKNEWSKVQGRFEEIPFIESSEQILRIVASAFEHQFSGADSKRIRAYIRHVIGALIDIEALPTALKKREAINLFEACYPLHPVSALILPVLCQKVAQNERTLFSYLGSHEEYGLADIVKQLNSVEEWVLPHHVFDYFINNQTAALSDYATHRRWAEVVTAMERLGDATEAELALLKTIGLLNIIGVKGGLKASKELLELCFDADINVAKGLKKLDSHSVITYRKFSGEYRVWQGSDFDLEEALEDGLNHIGEFELAEVLNEHNALQPVVARRYTIRNGTLRYFKPYFVDARSYKKVPSKADYPRLILFVAGAQDDEKIFFEHVTQHFSELDILCLCKNGSQLREATGEVMALRYIGTSRQELSNDPIAKREFEDRLVAAETSQELVLGQLLEFPEESEWFYRGKQLSLKNKRDFQEQLSDVLKKVYSKSPELHNELVNRDKPSSQVNSARIKLLHSMISFPGKRDLAIEKFPPEKAVYRSILLKSGLHRKGKHNKWGFSAPEKGTPFWYVWQKIDKFLESTEQTSRSFAELNQELMAPPYGVKAGILPIIYMAIYCVQQHELALYENQQYRPVFTDDMIDRFMRRPDEFTVQRFRIVGLRVSIYSEYKKLFNDGKEKTIVQLVRPLADLINGLEEYTQKTQSNQISEKAKLVRDAFGLAKSPEKLLFEDLPKALGYGEFVKSGKGNLEGFSNDLTESLRELKYAYENMRKEQLKLLAQAFHINEDISIDDLRSRAIGRYEGLEQYTVDVDGLRAFIKRITKREGTADEWFDNILMFLGQKPASKWLDADRSEAEIKLSDYSKRILDLETLRLHYDKNVKVYGDDFHVILLKTLKKGEEPIDEVVAIDQVRHKAIQDVKGDLLKKIDHHDKETQLAILAELVDEFLADYRKSGSKGKAKVGRPRKIERAVNDG